MLSESAICTLDTHCLAVLYNSPRSSLKPFEQSDTESPYLHFTNAIHVPQVPLEVPLWVIVEGGAYAADTNTSLTVHDREPLEASAPVDEDDDVCDCLTVAPPVKHTSGVGHPSMRSPALQTPNFKLPKMRLPGFGFKMPKMSSPSGVAVSKSMGNKHVIKCRKCQERLQKIAERQCQ